MKIKYYKSSLKTTESFVGEPLEEKVRRVIDSGAPVEAVSPMYYTERKEGVKPETDIRTDRFEIALNAMDGITKGIRQKREERMNPKKDEGMSANAGEPNPGSKINAQ